jgi:flagellar biosynthesis/type III secretory pathway M-ring protein FliF/YscJ
VISALVVFVVLAVVVFLVMSPLRETGVRDDTGDRDALEAAKEAKYREIRDADLDYRTGKLSEGDWRTLDRSLRAEAIELLDALERLE